MSKCGCPNCKGNRAPTTRNGWKALKNNHGNPYGTRKKPSKKHGRRSI